ncbi:MAG: EamA family transporter [Acidimicrobiales bacterium]
MKTTRRTALLTVLAPISWGTTYVTVTELLPHGRPLLVAALRVLPAGLVLVAVGTWRSRWVPRGRQWRHLAALAMFNFALFFPLLVVGVYRLPGGVAASFGGLQPLLVAGLSWLVAGRRARPVELAVGAIAALGVALVVVKPGAHVDLLGVLAAAASAVSFAAGVVLTKRLPPPPDRVTATGWQLLMSAAPLSVLAFAFEGAPPAPTIGAVVGFAYLSLAGTALAFVLWFRGIERLPTAAPPLLGLAAPVTGAVLGWLVKGESLSPVQLVGFAITIGAIARGATLAPRATTEPPTEPPTEPMTELSPGSAPRTSAAPASVR